MAQKAVPAVPAAPWGPVAPVAPVEPVAPVLDFEKVCVLTIENVLPEEVFPFIVTLSGFLPFKIFSSDFIDGAFPELSWDTIIGNLLICP